MTNERRFRVFVLANLASLAGRQHITGIYRFLGEGHLWDLNLIRSFADYSPRILRAAIRDGYDGYIFVAPGDRDTNALYARLGAPVVFIDQPNKAILARIPDSVFVNDDNDAIGKAAAQRLLSTPTVKSFAFAGVARCWSKERGAAFMRELRRCGHEAALVEEIGELPQKRLARRILALPKPCGIFAAYDDVGRRGIEAARDAKARIPDELEVLSVGNDDVESEGYRAARELQAMMSGARPRRRVFLFGIRDIIERGSTRNASIGRSMARAALAYIESNALRGITAEDVIRHLGTSRSLANLRFREETGMSLLQAILNVRLGEVKRMLSQTDLPIADIARRAGYPDANYLKNLFRRKTGASMRDWRRQNGATSQH